MSNKVFISWSGPTSRKVAEALKDWLGGVLQALDPWLSTEMDRGIVWIHEIRKQLEDTSCGILCMTSENLASEWIHFEAGALSKSLEESRVVPALFGVSKSSLRTPLSLHNACELSERREMFSLVETLNKAMEKPLDPARLDQAFDMHWPKLVDALAGIQKAAPSTTPRSSEEMLAEVLQTVRRVEREVAGHTHPTAMGSSGPPIQRSGGSDNVLTALRLLADPDSAKTADERRVVAFFRAMSKAKSEDDSDK